MLSNRDLYSEIETAEALLKKKEISDVEYRKASIKLQTLNLKLLHNIRANMVTQMKAQGIDLLKPADKSEEKVEEKTAE